MASGPDVPNSSVWPSAGARATYSAPMLPPAPARFSTIIRWAARALISAARVRAIASVGPPGGKGTTSVTGLSGKVWAWAAGSSGKATLAQAMRKGASSRMVVSGSWGSSGGGGGAGPVGRPLVGRERVARQHAVLQHQLGPVHALRRAGARAFPGHRDGAADVVERGGRPHR